MSTSSLMAVLDACVLVPAALCDFLLRTASTGLYHLRWSDGILDEVQRTLVGDLGKLPSQAARRIEAMLTAFPDAFVTVHRTLVDAMPDAVDAKDRHVVAAAVASRASVIVTSNLRDFPDKALLPLGIQAQSPDKFLLDLYDLDADSIRAVLERQAAALINPPRTPIDVIDALRREAPIFASLLDQEFQA